MIKKLKCVVISDTHGYHNEINFSDYENADVLIHCGDWTLNTINQDIQTKGFLKWMNNLNFKYKILIAGNHEISLDKKFNDDNNPEWFYKQLKEFSSIIYLENDEVIINGIKFYGSPYSNEFCGWAFMEHEEKLKEIWNKIPDDTNVLITHGPAYNCLDEVKNMYSYDNNVGSVSLSLRKQQLKKLKVHCSGHIHEAYGEFYDEKCDIKNICASIVNERYEFVNKPIMFEI